MSRPPRYRQASAPLRPVDGRVRVNVEAALRPYLIDPAPGARVGKPRSERHPQRGAEGKRGA